MKNDEYITITKESYQQMNHLLIERAKQIERLQEQLKEANNVICALFPLSMNKIKATDCVYRYMEKWGVK